MPAALKNPLPELDLELDLPHEPDFAPNNPTAAAPRASSGASSSRVAASVSGASARAASPARITPREREPERSISARPHPRPVEQPAPTAVARRPYRIQKHRDFRPGLTAMLCLSALMGQLVILIWLHGKTLSVSREVETMDTQIVEVSNQIESTQGRIADLNSSPQIKHWAAEKGWRPASHSDIDDTTKPEIARAQAQATAQAAPAQSNGEVAPQ